MASRRFGVRGHVPALRCAIDSLGAERLLLGTDFPYEAGDVFVRAVDYITDPRITEHEASAILEGNAAALLGITTPANAAR
jgi:6-methylsalicylate decarboxylase